MAKLKKVGEINIYQAKNDFIAISGLPPRKIKIKDSKNVPKFKDI